MINLQGLLALIIFLFRTTKQGPTMWNSLELDIKQCKSMKLFKTRMKDLSLKYYRDYH